MLICIFETTFHLWWGSTMSIHWRRRHSIWWVWTMTRVSPRSVNSVSRLKRIDHESWSWELFCVASTVSWSDQFGSCFCPWHWKCKFLSHFRQFSFAEGTCMCLVSLGIGTGCSTRSRRRSLSDTNQGWGSEMKANFCFSAHWKSCCMCKKGIWRWAMWVQLHKLRGWCSILYWRNKIGIWICSTALKIKFVLL